MDDGAADGLEGRPLPDVTLASTRNRVDLRLASRGTLVLYVEEQREFAERERIPCPLLNDSSLALARELDLPTLEVAGMTLYKRLTVVAERGSITKVFYPVFPPDSHPEEVLAWLHATTTG